MTLAYRPGDALAHRLDPRTKLAVQVGFAVAAFAHTTPRGLVVLSAVAGLALLAARTSPATVLVEYRALVPLLVAAPVLSALRLGSPWVAPSAAVSPALASYRVALLLAVSAAYVRTTPVRESRAAIQWLVPGRTGQFLGAGAAFVFRFVPLLVEDVLRARDAVDARLGGERPLAERMRIVGVRGVARAFERADRFALALRARCFAWNPTLPPLAFERADAPALAAAALLALSPML